MSENQKNDQQGKTTNTEPTKTQDLNKTSQNQQPETTKKTTNPEEGEEKIHVNNLTKFKAKIKHIKSLRIKQKMNAGLIILLIAQEITVVNL